ncbi:MAG: hypothetical protein NTV73_10515 [Hyphomicrobiales bacterium]|nr:hypothetical protein [Hyphomicrobiales bacterium]
MGRFLREVLITGGWLLLLFLVRTIFGVEIEEYWNGTIQPALEANAWSWVATMLSFVPTFWGGIVFTMATLLIVHTVLSWVAWPAPKTGALGLPVAGNPDVENAYKNLTSLAAHIATVRAFQFTREADEASGRLDWAKQQIMPFIALFGGSDLEELLRWIRNPDEYVMDIQRYGQTGRREALIVVCDTALRSLQDVMKTMKATGELRIPPKQLGTEIGTRR